MRGFIYEFGGGSVPHLRREIIQSINDHADDQESLIQDLQRIIEAAGREACSSILKVFTHHDFEHDEAVSAWESILAHREEMLKSLNRDVGLSTAICDYFSWRGRLKKSLVLLEIHIFEKHLDALKYDPLTGLHTRSYFEETLEREISRAKRHETSLSVIFFDVDDFKLINDTYGHLAGDEALRKIAEVIIEEKRVEDIAARFGGEEVVLILPETDKSKALVLAERIRKRVENMVVPFEDHEIRFTASGGLAAFPVDARCETSLLNEADRALYRAKNAGKNNIMLYSEDKRRYMRIDFDSRIQIQNVGYQGIDDVLQADSRDMSVAGILIECHRCYDIGSKIHLKIPLAGMDENLSVIGTVMRVEAHAPGRFGLGIAFSEMDKETRKTISAYISSRLEKMTVGKAASLKILPAPAR